MAGFLSKERIITGGNFNRWLIPPAALAVHLCIGMAYGFSVFWKPLGNALVGEDGKPLAVCAAGAVTVADKLSGTWRALFATDCNWTQFDLGWMYTLFFVLLGCSAALWGGWLERAGPRKAGLVATVCWCGGLLISALGVYTHQLWMMWLGSGVIGGIGLGLGYISPVSTLIKWFPDRRGMATGMAIMGFGGGAMIGSPLATKLMSYFATPTAPGVWQTFVMLALIYTVFMLCGSLGYRVPASDWKPANWVPPVKNASSGMIATRHVHINHAHKTPQFWLLWLILCMNVSASIGIIGAAAPMLQETFGGALIDQGSLSFADIKKDEVLIASLAAVGAGFVGLVSLFNIFGRFAWATSSDKLGRKTTYSIFFILGALMYMAAAWAAGAKSLAVFVGAFCIIASMYGGGFATIPAYLADMFGTQFVGAIHGRLLTAWSTAGIVGPVIVNYMHDMRLEAQVPFDQVYGPIFYVLAGMLVIGFVANLLVRPVASKHFMTDAELAEEKKLAHEKVLPGNESQAKAASGGSRVLAVFAWLAVGIPVSYGIWSTLQKAWALFH
ncbi:nitrate/nitrite transporter NarK [Methylovorus glucosotrophus]|uniref:OFA family MFS transporter n=1 Tax=Methylovorus glucosotrophus TaxID=266009 RepID=UPI001331BA8D|nr:OFA family MFS transporter [Methylovorus glucosotrophus]KAF0843261.1 nitrate/nitrite transporter NarK [Methylovorus glucosotrophus]